MTSLIKLTAIGLAALVAPVTVGADTVETFEIEFSYDPAETVIETYDRAKRTARKACKLKPQPMTVKRAQMRVCVDPLVEQIVLKSGDQFLMAHHADKTGQSPEQVQLVQK